jgi:transposase
VEGIEEFVGIDHHKRTSRIVIKDREGRILKQGTVATRFAPLASFLGETHRCRWAVFEAGPRYRPMWRWLNELVDGAVLANPLDLKIISETAYKSDKIDASKLADLLMLGIVPEAHVCSEEAWQRRQALRQRVHFVRMRSSMKNRVHAIVDQFPEASPERPHVDDLFGKLGRAWLDQVEIPRPDRRRLDQLLEMVEVFDKMVRRSDREVTELLKEDPRAEWLKTIPGIGPFFAALILAEVDDIRRFEKRAHFVSYTGLVPGRDQSAEVDRSRGVHKKGNGYLRWALVEAAIPAASGDLQLKSLYDRIRARRGRGGHNIAKVAVARRLAEIIYCILKQERAYERRT